MITINKQIPPMVLAGNPVKIDVSTDNLYTTAGVKTMMVYELGEFASLDEITLSWTDINDVEYTRRYVCSSTRTVPDPMPQDGNVYYFPVGAFPYQFYFGNDFDLAQTFDYVHETGYEKFTAKEASSVITLEITGDNSSVVLDRAGITPVKRIMDILLEVYEQSDNGLRLLGTDSIRPDDNGDAVFNISEYIYNLFEEDITPAYPYDIIDIADEFVKKYKFRLFEKYSGVLSAEANGSVFEGELLSYDFSAIHGQVSNEQFEALEANETSYYDQMLSLKEFLTQQPRVKSIDILQREILYFYFYNPEVTQIKTYIDIYFTDGTHSQINKDATTINISNYQYKVLRLNTGYIDLDISYPEGMQNKTAHYYDVWLTDQDNVVISEKMRYMIDRKYYLYRYEFVFRNHLGVFDTVLFTGKQEFSTKFTREFFEKLTRITQDKPDIVTEYEVSTGFLNKETKEWLQSIAASTDVYQRFFNDQGESYYRKLQVLNDDIAPVLIDGKYMEQFVMKYRFDAEENAYSKFKYPLWILEDGTWNINGYWLNYKTWNEAE